MPGGLLIIFFYFSTHLICMTTIYTIHGIKCLIYVVHDQRSRLHIILLELIYKDTTTLLLTTMHNHFNCVEWTQWISAL